MKNRFRSVRLVFLLGAAIGCGGATLEPAPAALGTERRAVRVDPRSHRMLDPNIPRRKRPQWMRDAGMPHILFVNFDGATLTSGRCSDGPTNCSTLVGCDQPTAYPAFRGTAQQRQQILDILGLYFRPYAIDVVTTRPTSEFYSMIMMGGRDCDLDCNCDQTSGGAQNGVTLGVAPGYDCGDENENDITFAFTDNADNDPFTIATTIAQEHAHAWGLEHDDNTLDLLYPFAMNNTYGFINANMHPVSVNYTTNAMRAVRSQCDGSLFQNSHQRMIDISGPGAPDTEPPVATIVYPTNGLTGFHGDRPISISVSVEDNFPTAMLASVAVVVDEGTRGELHAIDRDPPFGFLARLPVGTHTAKATATDGNGNTGVSTVTSFTVVDGPSDGGAISSGPDGPRPGTTTPPPDGRAADAGRAGDAATAEDAAIASADGAGTPEPARPDAGQGAGLAAGGGGCATAPGATAMPLAWLALAALLVRRRKR